MKLKEFFELAILGGEMRSVLGLGGLEAREVGIGARKGGKINLKLNICQMVNNKTFVLSEMRTARSNREPVFTKSDREGCGWQGKLGSVPTCLHVLIGFISLAVEV